MATEHRINITANDNTSRSLSNVESRLGRLNRAARSAGRVLAVGMAAGAAAAGAAAAVIGRQLNVYDELAKRARNAGVTTEESFRAFQGIEEVMSQAGISVDETARAMNNLRLRLADAAAGGTSYAEAYNLLGDSIRDANGEMLDGAGLFEAVGNAIQDGTLNLDQASSILGQRVGPKIFEAFQMMEESGMSLAEAMAAIDMGQFISLEDAQRAERINDAMRNLSNQGMALLRRAIEPLLPLLEQLVTGAVENLPGLLEQGSAALQTMTPLWDTLRAAFEAIASLWTNILQPAFEAMQPLFSALGEILGGALISGLQNLQAVFEALAALFAGDFQGALEIISTRFAEIGTSIMEQLGPGIEFIRTKFEEILEYLRTLPQILLELGTQLIQGLIDGIRAKLQELRDTLTGALDSVIERARNILRIQSPSRVFMEIGNQVMAGMAVGIQQGQGQVNAAMEQAVGGMETRAQTAGQTIMDGLIGALQDGKLEWQELGQIAMQVLQQIIQNSMRASQAASGIGGGLGASGGGGGGLFGIIGSLFGGFFDKGGVLGTGQVGIVGERGPELVRGPAQITSRQRTAQMMGGGGGDVYAPVFNVTVQGDANGDPEQSRKLGREINNLIEAKVADTMYKFQNRNQSYAPGRKY